MLDRVKFFNCNQLHTTIYDHPNYKQHEKLLTKEKFNLVQTNREYSCDIRKIDFTKYKNLINNLESKGIKFLDSKNEMLDLPNHYQKLENEQSFSKESKSSYEKFKTYFDEGDKKLVEQIKKDCELILLNNR